VVVNLPVLPEPHRRWLYRNAVLGAAIANLTINAGLAWASAHGHHTVPMWATPILGGPATFTDTVGTLFLLPLVTCVTVTVGVHREQRAGRLTPLSPIDPRRRALVPDQLVLRAAGFAVVTTALLLPVAAVGCVLVGSISAGAFIAYKGVLGVALGAIVTPLIAWCAMTDGPARPADRSLRLPSR
jgi:hypothetical protein